MSPRRPPVWLVDGLAALGVAGLIGVELGARWDDGYSAGPDALNVPLLLSVAGALAFRRRTPRTATAMAYLAVVVPSLLVPHTVFFFGTLLPLLTLSYTCARLLDSRRWLPTVLWPLVLPEAVAVHQPGFGFADYLFWFVLATLAVSGGRVMHHLDVQRASLSAVLAAQVQDQDARERALLQDERARIARELHDVVAHAVSVMVVQAGAARLAVGLDDDEAREGLRAVEVTGREALLDLRRLLSLLRPDDDGSTQPAPGLALLGPLVDRMRAAGLDVRLTVSGALRPLHAGLDLAAYRIVQEALTNVLKHAGSPNAAVELEYGDSLTLRITDPGPRTGGRGTRGQGVIGMRERAAVFGGTFAAGPHAEGWRVTATLPVPATDSAEAQP